MYFEYIKELHKFASKECSYNTLINCILSPLTYLLFIGIMSLNRKEYKKFKKNN